MAVTFDPSTDFEDVTDGLEAVTINRRGSSDDVSISHALQRALSTREIEASDGKYLAGDVRWHVPVVEVVNDDGDTIEPDPGDVIIDAADHRWTILEKRLDTLSHRWRLVTRDPFIAYGLDDTVDILRIAYAKGTSGADEPTAHVWKAGIRARIQPVASEYGKEHAAARRVKTVRITIAEDLDLHTRHQVRGKDGTAYKITGYDRAERIGELSTIHAEVTPWPQA